MGKFINITKYNYSEQISEQMKQFIETTNMGQVILVEYSSKSISSVLN